jgi:hypothetical protein
MVPMVVILLPVSQMEWALFGIGKLEENVNPFGHWCKDVK